jgi:predicted nucleic acid-binding Zn ribbon protein
MLDTHAWDRWLLCSDGLSSYVSEEKIFGVLSTARHPNEAADRLVKESLDAGAPDNVTVILLDVDGTDPPETSPGLVGAASAPLSFEPEPARRALRLPNLLLHPLKPTVEDSHFEPESDEYLQELIAEDRRRARRRRITWLTVLVLTIIAVVTIVVLAYQWTQSRYYVGADNGTVAIFQGVQQGIGPIPLSSVYESTQIKLEDLPTFTRESVEATISADDLAEARGIVERLGETVNG